MTETDALLILNAVPGLGNRRIQSLLNHFPTACRILSLSKDELASSGLLPFDVVQNILDFPKDDFLANEYYLMARHNVEAVAISNECYPKRLKEIPDAPVVLYCKGRCSSYNDLALAIVGSRRASLYGLMIAGQMAVKLTELGFTIVSGLARGIDTSAHQGCLKAQGSTWAVAGHGLAHRYPSENEYLFDKIALKGVVVSEFPMDTPPRPFNFPRRNRIISGLSLGVVVVEASLKSGALITSDCALEQGRDVFAVPGQIDHPGSRGVHHLIKQGAKLVTCVEDILEELKVPLGILWKEQVSKEVHPSSPEQKFSQDLTAEEQKVLGFIKDQPAHLDQISQQSDLAVSFLSPILLRLEMKKRVRQLPGRLFIR